MALFFLSIHRYSHMRSGDAALYGRLFFEYNARYAQRIQLLYKSIRIREQLQQRGSQHIPRRAHTTVKI